MTLDLDPVVHQTTRLAILGYLHRNRSASFGRIREALALTAGNLATHARRLEAAGYVRGRRVLAGLHFELRYEITPEGSAALRAYVAQLRRLLDAVDEDG